MTRDESLAYCEISTQKGRFGVKDWNFLSCDPRLSCDMTVQNFNYISYYKLSS